MSNKARVYFWLTVGVGAYIVYWYIPRFNYHSYNLPVIAFLALFAFFAEIYQIEILPRHSVSVSTAIYLSLIYIGGAPLAIALALPVVFFSEAIIRGFLVTKGATLPLRLRKFIFNVNQAIVSIGAASVVFRVAGGKSPPFTGAYDYLPPFLAFLSFIIVNISLVSGMIALAEGESFFYQLKFSLRNLHLQVFSLGVLSVLIAVIYAGSPWNTLLVTVLLLLVNTSVRSYIGLRKQAKRTFEKIMDLLNKRDKYTHKHSESVGDLTKKIVDRLKISPEKKEDIISAARVHDIGKLGIPDSILLKEDKLDDDEWEKMRKHPVLGADILGGLAIYENATDIVRHEHERWDGSGYPDGLEGEDIPLGSRIVAVADVWNALRTKRPYRGPLPKDEALAEIKEMSGVKLDPKVVDALLSVIESESGE